MNETNEQEKQIKATNVFVRTWHGLKSYLCDWRNLLGHALIGIVFLVVAIWAPISIYIKLGIIFCLICFNVWRMRRSAKKKAAANKSTE